MAVIPDDPTWAQIQTGLTGAGRSKRLAQNQIAAAAAVIKAEDVKVKVATQNVKRAEADIGQWLSAVKRKIDKLTS